MKAAHLLVAYDFIEQDTAIMRTRPNWSSILLTFGPYGNTRMRVLESDLGPWI